MQLSWDKLKKLLAGDHSWTGTQTFDSLKLSINVETLAANKTLVTTDKIIQWLDPDGSDRDVIAPAEADSTDLMFWVYNSSTVAGKNLVYKNDGGTTIATIGPGMLGIFGCDGTDWKWENDLGIYYDRVTSRIGKGVTTPLASLHLAGGDMYLQNARYLRYLTTGDSIAGSVGVDSGHIMNISNTYNDIIMKSVGAYAIKFYTSNVLKMVLDKDGNLGVNESNPIYTVDVAGEINQQSYYWHDDFDDEADGVQLGAGLRADFWTLAGTNYAAANLVYRVGNSGEIEAKCAAADNDSVTILGLKTVNIDQNPILEARIKIDTKETACFFVGFVDAAFADKATPANNMCCVGIDSDNGHGFGATQIVALSNDDAAGGDYDDMGSAIVSDTYIKIKIDLTDTEQPRIWIDDTEVAAGSISGTVKAATDVAPYIHVQNLAGAIQRFVTVDYIKMWATRA